MSDAADRTLGEVLADTVERFGDRPALLSSHVRWSWAELQDQVKRTVDLFRSVGIGPGEVVGFVATKRPEVVTGLLACAEIGAIMAPVN
ncbi:MAG: AMP-binding protein, partial [Myxococcota bacterium]|nr:AMP-binding protein [Myxococcota bacterium]